MVFSRIDPGRTLMGKNFSNFFDDDNDGCNDN